MASYDDRRKAAQILRSVDVDDILFDSELVDEIERACGSKRKRRNFRKIIDELVDIIDPGEVKECVTLSNDGVGEALPEALDAYDRDALIKLAVELDQKSLELLKTNDLDSNRKRRGMRRTHASDLMAASSRIREALGVENVR